MDEFSDLEKNVKILRNENQLLRDTADNAQLLKEQVEDLTLRLTQKENLLKQSQKKQDDLYFIERNIKQWKGIGWKLLNSNEKEKYSYDDMGPDLLQSQIALLQQECLSLTESIGNDTVPKPIHSNIFTGILS